MHLLPSSFPVRAVDQRGLVAVHVDAKSQTITLIARGEVGDDVLTLQTRQRSFEIPLRIALNAGTVPARATLRVTGNPLDSTWLGQQVQALLGRVILVAPGARETLGLPASQPTPPPPGGSASIAFPVRIEGDARMFAVHRTTVVEIRNLALAPFAPPLLYYDDDPEQIHGDGRLFSQPVSDAQPIRLYSYHQNGLTPRNFVVTLQSYESQPVRVQLIAAAAGPSGDVMSVGHATTRDFLVRKPINEGRVATLEPGIPYIVHEDALRARDAVADTLDIRVLTPKAHVQLTTMAISPTTNLVDGLAQAFLPPDGKARTGIFTIAQFSDNVRTYSVGGPDAVVEYGTRQNPPPLATPATHGRDLGDYGVLRTIVMMLINPLSTPSNVYLYEKPLGGIARSSFLVDGTLVQVGCVRLPHKYLITPFVLAPKMTYRLVLKTMTDGGSNYPLLVGVGSEVPRNHAPAVRAPDGCFPK